MKEYIEQIEQNGYCTIAAAYRAEETGRALSLVTDWYERTRLSQAETVPYLNRNQPMVYNLQNKEHYFLELLFSSELVEKLLIHFLNDKWYKQIPTGQPNYIMRSYLARSSQDALPLHIDSFVPYVGAHVISMQAAILLEDSTISNGCTLFVPGSHQAGEYVEQSALEDAVAVEGRRGDVIVWDSRLWHGANPSTDGRTRWALIATFSRWWLKQAFDIPNNLPESILHKLSPKQKAIMGFSSIPYNDETEGIDMKRGYESGQNG